jgi:hypothetical protein
MPTSLRSGCIKGGHLALVLLISVVVAHAQEAPGDKSGGGTQSLQERMYQERIKELGANQQQDTRSQGSGTGGAMGSQPIGGSGFGGGSSGNGQGERPPASTNKQGGK